MTDATQTATAPTTPNSSSLEENLNYMTSLFGNQVKEFFEELQKLVKQLEQAGAQGMGGELGNPQMNNVAPTVQNEAVLEQQRAQEEAAPNLPSQ